MMIRESALSSQPASDIYVFDRFVVDFLGLDRHPELRDMYFGNYTRLVYLSQVDDGSLLATAEACAERLGLEFEHVHSGYGELETSMHDFLAVG